MRILHVGYGFRPWRTGGLIEYAEGLMAAQARAGEQVGYFFAGRQYRAPFRRRTRLKRWRNVNGLPCFEVLDSPLYHGGDRGTAVPALDLDEPRTEALFRSVVREFRPDLVHVQELSGLPSSLLSIAADEFSLPVVMTLQDYFPLCPTLKLWDHSRSMCSRPEPARDCVVCCRHSGRNEGILQAATMQYEWGRCKDLVPRPLVRAWKRLQPHTVASASPAPAAPAQQPPSPVFAASGDDFQRRREINLQRLRRVSLLVAQSHRVEEIYRAAGAVDRNICTLNLTVSHLQDLTPHAFAPVTGKLRFVTLNGCYNHLKGAMLLLGALQLLHAEGLGERFELHSWGGLSTEHEQEFRGFPNFHHGGWYRPQQLNTILSGMHVGVIPSTWEEAFGFVGLEFLAKGIPVLGNARGGIVDYTREGLTGWVNRSSSVAELASRMSSLIRRPEEVAAMNRRVLESRARIIKTMEQHLEEMREVYLRAAHPRAFTRPAAAAAGNFSAKG